MPLDWQQLNIGEKAEEIIDMIEGLTNDDIDTGYEEWSENRYERSIPGEIEALSDFQQILTEILLKRLGKWDSYVKAVTSRKE